jgi:hypothetical protein
VRSASPCSDSAAAPGSGKQQHLAPSAGAGTGSCTEQQEQQRQAANNRGDDQAGGFLCAVDDTPAPVIPGLYIGSMLAERNRRKLRDCDITDILQVCMLSL